MINLQEHMAAERIPAFMAYLQNQYGGQVEFKEGEMLAMIDLWNYHVDVIEGRNHSLKNYYTTHDKHYLNGVVG